MEVENLIRVDKLGRIVIPVAVRRTLGIMENDILELGQENSKIIITKRVDKCEFCKSKNNLRDYHGKKICLSCLSNIKNNL